MIIDEVPRLPLERRILTVFEVNWRLETCLLPLFQDLASIVIACLKSINPFPDETIVPRATLQLSADNVHRTELAWPEIRDCWIALAFAIVRYLREERKQGEFDQWTGQLGQLPLLSSDQAARLCYEKSLYALGEMDDESVHNQLAVWPEATADPAWQLRRAGILAEIGELREARSIAERTLTKLRTGLRHTTNDIPLLSREGWAMLLLHSLSVHDWAHGRGNQIDYRGRWEQLSRLGCDPWSELEELDSLLNQPVPRPKASPSQRARFQPGVYTSTLVFLEAFFDRLIPAYQHMRLMEEGPYPPNVGRTAAGGKLLQFAAEWLIPYDPVRAQTAACRLLDKSTIEGYLSRHRVAWLSLNDVERFFQLSVRTIEAVQRSAFSSGRRDNEALVKRAHDRMRTALEILSRVVVRIPAERLTDIWMRALQLYSSPIVRDSALLIEPLTELFKSLILASEIEELRHRLLELVALPIPGSPAFAVALPQIWPELSVDIQKRLATSRAIAAPESVDTTINLLLTEAESSNTQVCGRAILRLSVLYENGCLGPHAVRRLARVFWDGVNERTGLPKFWGFRNWGCLAMPEPRVGHAIRRFHRYALNSKLPAIEGGGIFDNLLIDWQNATRPLRESATRDQRRQYVEWTSADVSAMLGTMREWWETGGRAQSANVASTTHALTPLMRGQLRERITRILDILRFIVIPRLLRDSPIVVELFDFVGDIERHGYVVDAVLPALLLLRPNNETASRLRHSLAALDEERYLAAVRGLIYWLENQPSRQRSQQAPQLPTPPPDLLQELGTIVAGRRQPGLFYALNAVSTILRHMPETTDEQFRASVRIGLDYLLADTAYRSCEDPRERIPYDDVPVCRREAAQIAILLRKTFNDLSSIIDQWISQVRADPLPEVRQVIGELTSAPSPNSPKTDSSPPPGARTRHRARKRG
jgi:hypothetical protein